MVLFKRRAGVAQRSRAMSWVSTRMSVWETVMRVSTLGRFAARVPGFLRPRLPPYGTSVAGLAAHSLVGTLHAVARRLQRGADWVQLAGRYTSHRASVASG
jgi:hypothetical protein